MRNKYVTKCLSALTACAIALQVPVTAYATDYNSVLRALPSAGVGYHFAAEQVSLSSIKQEVATVPSGGSAGRRGRTRCRNRASRDGCPPP